MGATSANLSNDEAARELVADWPPLTPTQCARLALLLRPARRAANGRTASPERKAA